MSHLSSTSSTGDLWMTCSLVSAPAGTIPSEGIDNEGDPRAELQLHVLGGLAGPIIEGIDRLVKSVDATSDTPPPPRPSVCPICGLAADNAVTVRSELTATATYCDTAGHLWSATWLEVAA